MAASAIEQGAISGRVIPPGVPTEFAGIPIAPVRELQPYCKMLIYGKPGSGKTTLAASASKVAAMCPVIHLSTDAAEAETLRVVAPDVVRMQIDKFDQFWDVRDALEAQCKSTAGPYFKTWIIDTGTEAQKTSMRDIMNTLMVKGRPGGGEVNPDVPSQREWGQSISEMRRLVRGFRDLPVNFIMCCHEAESRDNRGVNWIKPDLPGKLGNQVAGMFSNVVYLYTKQFTEREEGSRTSIVTEEKRLLLTGLTEGYVAKSRTGELPRVIEAPEMTSLYPMITAGNKSTDTETEDGNGSRRTE